MTRFPLLVLLMLFSALLPSCQSSPSPQEVSAAQLAKATEEMTFAELQLETARNDYKTNPHDQDAARRVARWTGQIARLKALTPRKQVLIIEDETPPIVDPSDRPAKK